MIVRYLNDLTGRAEWLDKGQRKCLILWHRIQDWADIIINFVSTAFIFLVELIMRHIMAIDIIFSQS